MLDACRAWVEADVKKLVGNYKKVRDFVAPSSVMAIAKAEAYGHGAAPYCRVLSDAGCEAFAVAAAAEAVSLREAGIKGLIFVLGWTDPEAAETLVKYDITVSAVSYAHALAMSKRGLPVKMHVAVDTGMKRLGEPFDSPLLRKIYDLPNIKITGTYSHLAMADSMEPEDLAFTEAQIKRFDETVAALKASGANVGKLHLQASYGIVNQTEKHYDFVRPGLLLFGVKSLGSDVEKTDLGLEPVLSVRARIASVKPVKKGETAGYNRHFTADKDCEIADVSIGYCDILPRCYYKNGGYLLINGRKAPVVDLCMDQLLADVTGLSASEGGVATVIGKDGDAFIPVEEVALKCGTISNEILSRIHSRVGVVYK